MPDDVGDAGEDGATYGLVMPFVSVRSVGGEYDDQAFSAGYQCGLLDAELSTCAAMPQGMPAIPAGRYVPKALFAQLDLIAMRHGYAITSGEEPNIAPGWVWVDFGVTGDGAQNGQL